MCCKFPGDKTIQLFSIHYTPLVKTPIFLMLAPKICNIFIFAYFSKSNLKWVTIIYANNYNLHMIWFPKEPTIKIYSFYILE